MKAKKIIAAVLCPVLIFTIMATGCSSGPKFGRPNNDKWLKNTRTGVYYQTELLYCKHPTDKEYQTLSIFVPNEYFNAIHTRDDRYKCTVNTLAQCGNYTYKTAPIVLDISSVGYNSRTAPTDYINQALVYTQRGYIYVVPGFRGAQEGAPYGVTDLKAAVRYLRYIDGDCPGDAERIYAMGTGGAGGLAAVLGTSGDSPLYDKYLDKIGAVKKCSDAIYGVMCWSPNTSLDTADAAYEWNMGATRGKLSDKEQRISDALAAAYVEYINDLGLRDGDTDLTISGKDGGAYTAHIKGVIEDSLNTFLQETEFPYTARSITDGISTVKKDTDNSGTTNDKGQAVLPDDYFDEGDNLVDGDNILRSESKSKLTLSGEYANAEEYIKALNKNKKWVLYDKKSNTATITSVTDFVQQMKGATRGVGAFDQTDKAQAENLLFGTDGEPRHFDTMMIDALSGDADATSEYEDDIRTKDDMETAMTDRVKMYSPLYFIKNTEEAGGKMAQHWRIRSGISQGDTALCTEINLALALQQAGADVDFAELWATGNEKYEPGDNAEPNSLTWLDNIE